MAIVRQSRLADSKMVAEVICRSVTELCVADHQNKSEILESWLANKTPESAEEWISAIDSFCVTALAGSKEVVGFGMLSREGEIKLLYVRPDQIGTGAGRDMLSEIERHAMALGLDTIFLDSTDSAMQFYKYHGYTHSRSCDPRSDGLNCNGMSKNIAEVTKPATR